MRRSSAAPSARDLEDRVQRLSEENKKLKLEKNQLEEKYNRVKVQFQRLQADWRQTHPGDSSSSGLPLQGLTTNATSLPNITATPHRKSPMTPLVPSARRSSAGSAAGELAAARAALAQSQEEVSQLRRVLQAQPAANTSEVALLRQRVAELTQQSARSMDEARGLREQLYKAQEDLQRNALAAANSGGDATPFTGAAGSIAAAASQATELRQQLEQHYAETIKSLREERDKFALQSRLLEAEKKMTEESQGAVDPMAMIELQNEMRSKSNEVSLISSRLQYAQSQVETLKGECARLVEELKHSHNVMAETKKELFKLEHDRGSLQARCERLDETELCLQRKSEEVLRLESELLKSVGSLQSCNRETEAAVRREFQARLQEMQEMRDQADTTRRNKEKALLETQQQLADVKRKMESLVEDVSLYKTELAKAEKERSSLSAQLTFGGLTTKDLDDEEVHRALAVAALKKRGGDATSRNAGLVDDPDAKKGLSKEATDALDLYDALQWDDNWELGQMREALATAALDMELAETRCQQMVEQVEQGRDLLKKMSTERDDLLEENVEMRRRLRHVQTVLAKQQLHAYRAAAAESASDANRHNGLISFCVRDLQAEEGMLAAFGVADFSQPVNAFVSLDGFLDYDTMLSPPVHTLQEALDFHFQYADLDKDEITIAEIQQTTFTFQLHRASGDGSAVVAMAELPGVALLTAREVSQEECLLLIDGNGRTLGRLVVEFSCSRLMLPVLLGEPLQDDQLALSAAAVKSALVALRAVAYLRVQVFRAEGLPGSSTAPPQPYVFYTANVPLGTLSCVRDTVVRPASRALTTEPTFEASPTDHRVVIDRELIRFIRHGSITFVLFDELAKDPQANLGVVEVALRPLLASPQACIRQSEALHPQGSLSVGISWVTAG